MLCKKVSSYRQNGGRIFTKKSQGIYMQNRNISANVINCRYKLLLNQHSEYEYKKKQYAIRLAIGFSTAAPSDSIIWHSNRVIVSIDASRSVAILEWCPPVRSVRVSRFY